MAGILSEIESWIECGNYERKRQVDWKKVARRGRWKR